MKNKKIAIVYGTRPEIIKLTPIIRECQKRKLPFFCIHTGQHYSFEMDAVFFQELDLPTPEYKLGIGTRKSTGHGNQVGMMLTDIEEILLKEKPNVVIVQGDTNTVLAATLTAVKIPYTDINDKMSVAHVEAGLRSYDRQMPEELNRVMVDHVSDYLFPPTKGEQKILLNEGIDKSKVFVVGNTIVDMVLQSAKMAITKSTVLEKLNLQKNNYILLTMHRQENVDSKKNLTNILKGLETVIKKQKLPVIFPIHPRTEKMLSSFGLELPTGISTTKPLGYLDFISLQANAALILTDSGGLQEEACILQVPCVTLRNNTERPETVKVGANIIAGTTPSGISKSVTELIIKKRIWKNPLGDGTSSKKILDILLK